MHKKIIFLLLLCFCSISLADPWFTGPLLAPAGKTIPLGHSNLEFYTFLTHSAGTFNRHWKLVNTPAQYSTQYNPLYTYGLSDRVDVQMSIPYSINRSEGFSAKHIGDLSVLLGFQALKQYPGSWVPDLRITIQQIFPTGRFDGLNPTDKGIGATGSGSYQSVLTLNFQYLTELLSTHYLRTRVSVAYLQAAPVALKGFTVHGGTINTHGRLHIGNLMSADVASEFTITQNWVAVMEGYYIEREPTKFKGSIGVDEHGNSAALGHGQIVEYSLAPAIEYNFSANYGIIAGVWFAIAGKQSPDFRSIVIALNAVW